MRILGIDAGNKEATVALVVDGRLVAATAEERHSRRRFDRSLPRLALARVLDGAGLTLDAIDAVAGNVDENQLRRRLGLPPRDPRRFPSIPGGPESHGFHHLSHAAFSFLTSGFEQALVVTVDNHGDNDTLVVFRATRAGLVRLGSVPWQPVPIGGVYEEATGLLGFGEGGEGKLMGLAGYGRVDPDRVERLLRRSGPWSVDSAFLRDFREPTWTQGRAPWAPIDQRGHADLAADVQASLEATVLGFIVDAMAETGLNDICLAGGVALNCSLNGAVARLDGVGRVWVSMSPGDPGNAAGAALLWAMREGEVAAGTTLDGGLGARWSFADLEHALASRSDVEVDAVGPAASNVVAERAAADIADGLLVGWFEGGSEFGPRALGHRSILADPRNAATTDRVNDAKLRRHWRPVAPSILAERAGPWLVEPQRSPFMLMAFTATDRMRERAPAAVHIDGTTRAQTVHKAQPAYHALLSAFEAKTGLPLVLNTSFNQAGEPIVESPGDALDCARRAGLDVVWLDGVRVKLRNVVRPVDTRSRRLPASVAGPVSDGWVAALCRQPFFAFSGHVGAVAPSETASRVLGLRAGDPDAPVLATGAAHDNVRSVAAGQGGAAFIHGPTSAWDGATNGDETWAGSSVWLTAPAVRRLVDSAMSGRLGTVRDVSVDMPRVTGPLDDPDLGRCRWRLAWDRFAQGLAIVRRLTNDAAASVAVEGSDLGRLELHVSATDGSWSARIAMGGDGPMPAIDVTGSDGRAASLANGRVITSVRGADGEESERREDTERGPGPFFAAVATHLGDQSWPHEPRLLHRCGTDVDAALAGWGRRTFGGAGSWSRDERVSEATHAGRDGETNDDSSHADLLAAGLIATLGYRPFAVAAGLRDVASYENANETSAAVVEAIAAQLGLHTRRGPAYRCAVTRQQQGNDRFTLFLSRDPAQAEQAVRLTAALHDNDRAAMQARQRKLGALFGYPTCCVAAWHRWHEMHLDAAFTLPIASGTSGLWSGYCNVRPPARVADHLPCSFSCRHTATLARDVVEHVADRAAAVHAALAPAVGAAAIPGLDVQQLQRCLAGGPDVVHDVLTATLFAPLLYIDTTRYAVFVGGKADALDDGSYLVSGDIVSSGALIGAAQTPEEAVIQRRVDRDIVTPLRPHQAGVRVRVDGGQTRVVAADGDVLLQSPANRLLLLPFGPRS